MPTQTLRPVALGFYRDWPVNTVGNVNDASDATRISTSHAEIQSYTVDPLTASAVVVDQVEAFHRISVDSADWHGSITPFLRLGGQNKFGTKRTPIVAVTEYSEVLTKPDGTAWTPADLGAGVVEIGVKAGSEAFFDPTKQGRCEDMWFVVTYQDVPAAPPNFTATVINTGQVDLAWTDVATETGYKVERADGPGGAFAQIATPAADATSHSDTTVKNHTFYRYRIRANNASGDGPYSNEAAVTVGVTAGDQASFSIDAANARFEVLRNIRNHGYRSGVPIGLVAIKFDIGGGEIGPTNFDAGAYDNATSLAAGVQAAIRTAIGGGDTTGLCTYSDSTHKITAGRSSGQFDILIDTGDDAYKAMSIWTLVLGFNRGADKTGASSYVADNPTFEDADKEHLTLVACRGFKDDGSGTYTGTASATLTKAPDIARMILERYLGVPTSRIDATSFNAARSLALSAVNLLVWIQDREEVAAILERIENGALADIVTDSEGTVFYVPYSDTTVRRSFFDRDYLEGSFKVRKAKASAYRGVRIHYGLRPHNGQRDVVESVDASTEILRKRSEMRELVTYIRDKADAEALAVQAKKIAIASPLEVQFASRSKLVDLKVADVIELTRSRAFSSTGTLSAQRFKIVNLRHDYGSGVSQCYAVEQVSLA